MRFTPDQPAYNAQGLAGSSDNAATNDDHEGHGGSHRVFPRHLHESHSNNDHTTRSTQHFAADLNDGMQHNWTYGSSGYPTTQPEVLDIWRQGQYSTGRSGPLLTLQDMEREWSLALFDRYYFSSNDSGNHGYPGIDMTYSHGPAEVSSSVSPPRGPMHYEHDNYTTGLEVSNPAYVSMSDAEDTEPLGMNGQFMGLNEPVAMGLGHMQQPLMPHSGVSESNIDSTLPTLRDALYPMDSATTHSSSVLATASAYSIDGSTVAASTSSPSDANALTSLHLVCPICERADAWSSYDSFVRHVHREHGEGVETFKCTDCDYTSIKPTDVTRHHNSRHSKAHLVSCPLCLRTFVRTDNCRRHIRNVHHSNAEPLEP